MTNAQAPSTATLDRLVRIFHGHGPVESFDLGMAIMRREGVTAEQINARIMETAAVFTGGRWTYDTTPTPDRTDAVQVALFAADTVDQPSLFGAL